MGTLILSALFSIVALVVYKWYLRFSKSSLDDIRGPLSDSWLYGNVPALLQSQAGEMDFKWQETYGDVVKLKGPLGQNALLVSDPKAIQYIYQSHSYQFPKNRERLALTHASMGSGLVHAEGSDHKRQRKILLPGFGGPEARALLPAFANAAASMVEKWHELITSSTDKTQSAIVDIPSWTSRATLDAIGEAAFDYKFGALEDTNNKLSNAYRNLFVDTFGHPTKNSILLYHLAQLMPLKFWYWMVESAPNPKLDHVRRTGKLAKEVARQLVQEKGAALLQGEAGHDVMSLVVKANASSDPDVRLNEDEMLSMLSTMILAGHETTSNTLCFIFLELARRPEMQKRIRSEIRAVDKEKRERGETEWSWRDFEETRMPFMNAVLKETMRFHPVAYILHRQAGKDDVLPLAEPITTESGKVIKELPIPKGVKLYTSIAGYNRNKSVFGDDAHVFNPERFLHRSEEKNYSSSAIGVYANLFTFSGGPRSCIGWRFAVLELQTFLVEMINNFEFSHTKDPNKYRKESCGIMTPTVEGEIKKGSQLPLRITVASRDD